MASRIQSSPSSTDSDFPGFNPSEVAKAAKRSARKIKYTREEEEYILNASFDSSDEEIPLKRIRDARFQRGAIGKRNVSWCGQSVSPLHISLTIYVKLCVSFHNSEKKYYIRVFHCDI